VTEQEKEIVAVVLEQLPEGATVHVYDPEDVPDEGFKEFVAAYNFKGRVYRLCAVSQISGRVFAHLFPLEVEGRHANECGDEILRHFNEALQYAEEHFPVEEGSNE
jgi:hypothetical protein